MENVKTNKDLFVLKEFENPTNIIISVVLDSMKNSFSVYSGNLPIFENCKSKEEAEKKAYLFNNSLCFSLQN